MKPIVILISLLASASTFAHTQSPGKIVDKRIYKEVNSYEFTLVNRNKYLASYDVIVGDLVEGTKKMKNGKVIGRIENLKYNESVKFNVDIRVPPATTRKAVMCTELAHETASFKSRVCSLLELTRR